MPFLPHPDTRNLVFPSATGTLGYNNSTGWINNLPILSLHSRQVSADVQRSQLDEWGAMDLLTSARFSLCALFYKHSPITESSLQFAAYAYLLCTYLRLVLDMIFSSPPDVVAARFLFQVLQGCLFPLSSCRSSLVLSFPHPWLSVVSQIVAR